MNNFFVGRQPIIDHKGNLVAYDLFYKAENENTTSSRAKTSTLVASVLNTFGSKGILGERRGFIEIDKTFLLSELILSTPKDLFVFALNDDIVVDRTLIERVSQLHAEGYLFAIHDITVKTGSLKRLAYLFPYLNYFKINIKGFTEQYLAKIKEVLSDYTLEIIATHVDEQMQYAVCRSVNYPLIQGLYFSEPVFVENSSFDPNQFAIIRIYNLLLNEEVEIDEIVKAFESNHALTLQLMQYINSSAFGIKTTISSISQMLTLLGRKPLTQWLMLLIYGKSMNHSANQLALLLMVMTRTEMMVGLLKLICPNASKEMQGKAFFVGVMSLSSTVFSVPLRLILKEMNLSEDVREALLESGGLLGEILKQVQAIEKYNIAKTLLFAKKFEISVASIQKLMTETIRSVNDFEKKQFSKK